MAEDRYFPKEIIGTPGQSVIFQSAPPCGIGRTEESAGTASQAERVAKTVEKCMPVEKLRGLEAVA